MCFPSTDHHALRQAWKHVIGAFLTLDSRSEAPYVGLCSVLLPASVQGAACLGGSYARASHASTVTVCTVGMLSLRANSSHSSTIGRKVLRWLVRLELAVSVRGPRTVQPYMLGALLQLGCGGLLLGPQPSDVRCSLRRPTSAQVDTAASGDFPSEQRGAPQ